ncbi:hypothetical protein NEPAR08_2453 [Nematocida parisii]|nr:hypothetical protein NEPAR08_2453 [Nematocida parisii]
MWLISYLPVLESNANKKNRHRRAGSTTISFSYTLSLTNSSVFRLYGGIYSCKKTSWLSEESSLKIGNFSLSTYGIGCSSSFNLCSTNLKCLIYFTLLGSSAESCLMNRLSNTSCAFFPVFMLIFSLFFSSLFSIRSVINSYTALTNSSYISTLSIYSKKYDCTRNFGLHRKFPFKNSSYAVGIENSSGTFKQ